jgi:hypothetical protein
MYAKSDDDAMAPIVRLNCESLPLGLFVSELPWMAAPPFILTIERLAAVAAPASITSEHAMNVFGVTVSFTRFSQTRFPFASMIADDEIELFTDGDRSSYE